MKKAIFLFSLMLASFGFAQQKNPSAHISLAPSLNQAGALKLAEQANLEASKLNKKVSIAVLYNSGVTILLL